MEARPCSEPITTSKKTLTGSDLLAEIGLNPGAVRDVIDENHATRCPDPRDAAGGDPLTVTAALTAGTE